MLLPGVHTLVSLAPPLHVLVVALQIGQGWMNVRHLPPGQSALMMHPKPAFDPPMHCPVSHDTLQSKSEQQGVSAGSVPPLVHRPVSFTHVPPPGQVSVPVE